MKNKEKIISVAILALSLIVSGGLIANAQTASGTTAGTSVTNPFAAITYPIPELGNCADQASCKTYCDVAANMPACLDFAQAHNLMSQDQINQARKMANIVSTGGGPGGCTSKDSCENYCENSAHIDECLAFAQKNGMMDNKDIQEAQKILPYLKSGQTPGGCTSKDQCENYCKDPAHATECVTFAQKAGLISQDEANMALKTGGKGPGGCDSKDSCDAFCNQKDNQQTCFNFAKENGLISEDQLKNIEEGTARLRMGLAQAPGEVVQCLKDKIGPDAVGQIESGQLVPNGDLGDTIQGCFNQFKPQFQNQIQDTLKNAPPQVTSCLQNVLGQNGFRELEQGNVSSTDQGDSIKNCFEQMGEMMKNQNELQKHLLEKQMEGSSTGEGDQGRIAPPAGMMNSVNQLPQQLQDCVKANIDQNATVSNIQEKVAECVKKSQENSGQGDVGDFKKLLPIQPFMGPSGQTMPPDGQAPMGNSQPPLPPQDN